MPIWSPSSRPFPPRRIRRCCSRAARRLRPTRSGLCRTATPAIFGRSRRRTLRGCPVYGCPVRRALASPLTDRLCGGQRDGEFRGGPGRAGGQPAWRCSWPPSPLPRGLALPGDPRRAAPEWSVARVRKPIGFWMSAPPRLARLNQLLY